MAILNYTTMQRKDRTYTTLAHQPRGAVTQPGDRPECRKYDPELWFPISELTASSQEQIETAKSICAVCPLVAACGQRAIEAGIEYGIWGGLTPTERRSIRRQQNQDGGRHVRTPAAR